MTASGIVSMESSITAVDASVSTSKFSLPLFASSGSSWLADGESSSMLVAGGSGSH